MKAKSNNNKWGFGVCIQAYRFGFGILPGNRSGLMRINPGNGKWLCELRPIEQVPQNCKGGTHVVWWATNHGRDVVESSPVLRAIKKVHRPFSVMIDENGELCGHESPTP